MGGASAGVAASGAGNAGTGAIGQDGGAETNGGSSTANVDPAKNYEVTGTWPQQPVAVATKPGKLQFTKLVIHAEFLAESCSIGDYDKDGVPDVSSGRIWYQGPDFETQHPFRDGHGPLPRTGAVREELYTGVSDDVADYPLDVDADGDTDIVNCAQSDANELQLTPNKIGTVQPRATCYWYENPGPAQQAGDPKWQAHLMHDDVRLEHHGLIDLNLDGFPEIFGACFFCEPRETKGFYQADRTDPTKRWTFHSVTPSSTFPFATGSIHGAGGGDLNGDGLPDFLERSGAWLQQADGSFNSTPCIGKNTPKGCGFVEQQFYGGLPDSVGFKGGSHMYAIDMDLDGVADVVSADWAHGEGLAWYKQGTDGKFTKYYFMGSQAEAAKFGVYFTEPHALQVVDMDGDGRPDVVTGKMRFANPLGENDPDAKGVPYIYVFRNVGEADPNTGAPIRLEPMLVDPIDTPPINSAGTPEGGMGVGRQIAIGHANTDGVLDICVATKVGLAVFLGQ